MALSAAILAGGQSTRMGQEKGLVELQGRPMVEHVHAALRSLETEIFIVTNQPHEYSFLGLRTVSDQDPGRGSLEGLRSALGGARTERVLVVGCDMPFLQPELLQFMSSQSGSWNACVPRFEGRLQPFFAVYDPGCVTVVEESLLADRLEMQTLLEKLQLREIPEPVLRRYDPEGLSFINVNTPEELSRARELMGQLA